MRSLNVKIYRMNDNATYNEYSAMLDLPVENVRSYLEDVSSLVGKLPNGVFTRKLTENDEERLKGLKDTDFRCYQKQLVLEMKKRLMGHGSGSKLRGICQTELEDCRNVALGEALKRLIPGFVPETISVEKANLVVPTPMGGQPPRGRRHP